MSDSKGETSGKAPECHASNCGLSTDTSTAFRVVKDGEPLDYCCIECAVVDAEERGRLAGIAETTEAEARLPHLEQAAELLRRTDWKDYDAAMHDWWKRDQALSAPTAESGKDSEVSWGAPASPPSAYPKTAPVAEAPERVTFAAARAIAVNHVTNEQARVALLGHIDALWAKQEQLEREPVELRKLLQQSSDAALRNIDDAEQLQKERDTLRAKLSEAERKLASALTWISDQEKRLEDREDREGVSVWQAYHLCRRAIDYSPTGGEPAKPELPLDAARHRAPGLFATPPAAEAEPRFRVGQPARPIGNIAADVLNCANGWEAGAMLIGNNRADEIAALAAYVLNEEERPDEPADPAPPRSGRDRPVMMSELIRALRLPGAHGPAEYALNRVATELEGGKDV